MTKSLPQKIPLNSPFSKGGNNKCSPLCKRGDRGDFIDTCVPRLRRGRTTLRLPKHTHQKLLETAQSEGVSLNQLVLTYIAKGLERTSAKDYLEKVIEKQNTEFNRLNIINYPQSLIIEPRIGVSFKEKRFFTSSPADSKTHIKLISEFEKKLKKK